MKIVLKKTKSIEEVKQEQKKKMIKGAGVLVAAYLLGALSASLFFYLAP